MQKELKLGVIAIVIVCLTSCQKSEPVSINIEEPKEQPKTIAAPKVTKRDAPKPELEIKPITPSFQPLQASPPQLTEIKVAFNQSQSTTYKAWLNSQLGSLR